MEHNVTSFFINKEGKNTILGFSQRTVRVFNFSLF